MNKISLWIFLCMNIFSLQALDKGSAKPVRKLPARQRKPRIASRENSPAKYAGAKADIYKSKITGKARDSRLESLRLKKERPAN